jgi:hypothetical protein
MVETLNELASLAKTLNDKSDQANKLIASINERLAELNVGLEVWSTDRFVSEGDWFYRNEDRKLDLNAQCFKAVLLGYCRFDDGWELALKSCVVRERPDPQTGNRMQEITSCKLAIPLLKGSREERVGAVHLIDPLLQEIKKRAQTLISEIDGAAEAASKF